MLLDVVNTKITNVKMRKLIGVNREIMEEALNSLNIGAKTLACCSKAMWDILLPIEEVAKSLAGNILTTKSVRLQTEYMGQSHST